MADVSDQPGEMTPPDDTLTVSLHGPGVTIEAAIEAGMATKALLSEIGLTLGVEVDWSIVSIHFRCDGCGLTRPDRPGPDEGWTYSDGNDLCPDCSADA